MKKKIVESQCREAKERWTKFDYSKSMTNIEEKKKATLSSITLKGLKQERKTNMCTYFILFRGLKPSTMAQMELQRKIRREQEFEKMFFSGKAP